MASTFPFQSEGYLIFCYLATDKQNLTRPGLPTIGRSFDTGYGRRDLPAFTSIGWTRLLLCCVT